MSQISSSTSGGSGPGGSFPASVNTYYFDKNGSDTNSGESLADAFLTIGAAITAANAQSPVWGINCVDNGTYVENLSIPAGINIWAPNATITGSVTFSGSSGTNTLEVGVISGSATALIVGSNIVYVKGDRIIGTSTGATLSTGQLYVDANVFYGVTNSVVTSGAGIATITADSVVGSISNTLGTVNITCGVFTGAEPTGAANNVTTSDALYNTSLMRMQLAGAIQTGVTNGYTALFQAYDVDNTTYRTFMTLTAGNTPTLAISSPAGAGTSTIDNMVIGSTTPANAQFLTPVNNQTGTTYTLVATDAAKMVTLSNASPVTLTLPQQSTLTTSVGYWAWIENKGSGTATIVKEGAETLKGNTTLATNAVAWVYRDTTTSWQVFGGTATVNMPGYNTLIETVSNVTYTLVGYAGNAGTLLGVYQKCRALTTAGTFNIQINGVNVTSLTSVVPSTAGSYTAATGANTFARGDQITIVFSGTNAVLDQNICIDFTQQF